MLTKDVTGSEPNNSLSGGDPDISESRSTEAFSLLGNDTRLAILLALWETEDPGPETSETPTNRHKASFSELQEHVGISDSGQFNYHLGKLEDEFIENTSDGYSLSPAGYKIVRTLIANSGFGEVSLSPSEIDLDCPYCGGPTAVTYQDQRLYFICSECEGYFDLGDDHPSGVLSGWPTNPTALSERGPNEIYSAVRTAIYHQYAETVAGVCPDCTGRIESSLHICENHASDDGNPCPHCGRKSRWMGSYVCAVCKLRQQASPKSVSLRHPAVIAFYWKHGIELGLDSEETARQFVRFQHEADEILISENPPRALVSIEHDGDELELLYDGDMQVIEVTEDH